MLISRSSLVQRVLRIGIMPLLLKDFPYMYTVYDSFLPTIVYMTARQIGKSTTWGSFLISDSISIPGFRSLYVTPSADQTKYFSNNRLRPMLRDSDFIMKNFYDKSLSDTVLNLELRNKSRIHLRYAFLNADRIRGMSVDSTLYDEVQDILTDIIPVIQECSFRSKYGWKRFSGTPKTYSNTLTKLWEDSKQYMWAVKCTGCNKHDFLNSPKNVGKTGPICKGCGKAINYMNGHWVMNNPNGKTAGFHISQLMIPTPPHQWQEKILSKLEGPAAYTKHVFYNEVLGLPYDTADAPVTRSELEACCDPGARIEMGFPARFGGIETVMGIDWGYGISSYTVATVGFVAGDGRFRVVWMKKYVNPIERDVRVQIEDLAKWAYIFKVRGIGADWGAGVDRISELRMKVRSDIPVFAFQAVSSTRKLYYDPRDDIFRHSRTQTLTDRFVEVRNQQVIFPCWKDFEPFGQDILNEFIEYSTTGKLKGIMIYDHAVDKPDDFLHSWNYAKMAADVIRLNVANSVY